MKKESRKIRITNCSLLSLCSLRPLRLNNSELSIAKQPKIHKIGKVRTNENRI